jgi:hypothetical protein
MAFGVWGLRGVGGMGGILALVLAQWLMAQGALLELPK